MLKERGLVPSQAVKDAIGDYHYDSDKIAQFFDDVLIPDPNGQVRSAAVYDQYKSWCKRNGVHFEGSQNFSQALCTAYKVVKKRPRGGGGATNLLMGYTLPNDGYYDQQSLFDMAGAEL
jgi:putative DNA primase/helicase